MSDSIEVRVHRGELVESRHRVDAALVDEEGGLLARTGEAELITFWRSSAKPFQAIPFIAAGGVEAYSLTTRDIAVMCASHEGTDTHVEQVSHLLKAVGCDEAELQCGAHPPGDRDSAERLVRSGERPSALHNNCSGKHAGMLGFARLLGVSTEGYLQPDHPVQERILDAVSRFAKTPKEQIALGIDGCGVPVFGLSLAAMAAAYARLAGGRTGEEALDAAARTAREAMQSHPFLVGGAGQLTTDVMESLGTAVVAKGGAEGLFCLGLTGPRWGLALKARDGASRALGPALLAILDGLGLAREGDKPLDAHRRPLIKNHAGTVVGHIDAHLPEAFRRRLEGLKEALRG